MLTTVVPPQISRLKYLALPISFSTNIINRLFSLFWYNRTKVITKYKLFIASNKHYMYVHFCGAKLWNAIKEELKSVGRNFALKSF